MNEMEAMLFPLDLMDVVTMKVNLSICVRMILRGEDNPIVYWEKKVYKFTEFRKNDRNSIILSNLTSRIYIRVIGLILTK
jgi:hypothetical protein